MAEPTHQPQTLFLAGGGTGGHLYPGLAVAQSLQRMLPDARLVFLCTQREIDRVILEPSGFEFIPQPIVPPRTTIGGLLRFWKSWRETKDQLRQVLKQRWPAAVIGLGGYAAGAAVRMAAHRGIPTILLNPDALPGKANQFLLRHARAACCQFAVTAEHVPADQRSKLHITGCPIRREIISRPPRGEAIARLNLQANLKTLVVTGASLGARTVNEAMLSVLAGGMPTAGWQVLHLAGREHAEAVRAGYRDLPQVAATVIDFTPAMADVWAVADLCLSRSGASSCAELTACSIPSILMPYPFHKDMHQRANATVLADAGAAVLLDDEKDRKRNGAKLRPMLEGLMPDDSRRATMAAEAGKLGRTGAAEAVAEVVRGLVAAKLE
jgi:UDP-N-acetylglucosamine--N-acetylmuramyl-(pentapeptide) pyrophosphoryl-undecaprenol N-acetylglucosamine transferase